MMTSVPVNVYILEMLTYTGWGYYKNTLKPQKHLFQILGFLDIQKKKLKL